jgi:divalent metal cation (Fe/Co/Zn/Cd) transporter
VDLHVLLDGGQTLDAAHLLTEHIEQAVQKIIPDADVTVHPEPETARSGSPNKNDQGLGSDI